MNGKVYDHSGGHEIFLKKLSRQFQVFLGAQLILQSDIEGVSQLCVLPPTQNNRHPETGNGCRVLWDSCQRQRKGGTSCPERSDAKFVAFATQLRRTHIFSAGEYRSAHCRQVMIPTPLLQLGFSRSLLYGYEKTAAFQRHPGSLCMALMFVRCALIFCHGVRVRIFGFQHSPQTPRSRGQIPAQVPYVLHPSWGDPSGRARGHRENEQCSFAFLYYTHNFARYNLSYYIIKMFKDENAPLCP